MPDPAEHAVPDAAPLVGSWQEFAPVPLTPILEAALAAFNERGYNGAAVRDIAGRVGVTVPTLYYHHGSKQGMLLALLQASMGDLVARTSVALEEAGDHPLHRFVDLVDCTVRFMCHRQRLAWLDPEARYLDDDARTIYAAPRKLVEERLLAVVRAGDAAGTFDVEHPVDTTRALLGTFQSIATWYRADGPLTPEEIAARHVAFALDAVRTDRRRRTAGVRRARTR
ncbi:TetR/AcrR family transcriptional regulator [Nitriliruptor alkaliphilus]|uniref:TetR/AcrR family transcriptional regulator n=1 Tax=Nitriliruptor alkaliphilus TaxID=427918 RepID=UPI0009F9EC0B|nr:TetR/AcrR family transcriptional regulator [Nitriliruptor alkaliphilus]